MSSQLFKNFIKKAILDKQPGGPPRPGLQWKPTTHRWIRPTPIDEDTLSDDWRMQDAIDFDPSDAETLKDVNHFLTEFEDEITDVNEAMDMLNNELQLNPNDQGLMAYVEGKLGLSDPSGDPELIGMSDAQKDHWTSDAVRESGLWGKSGKRYWSDEYNPLEVGDKVPDSWHSKDTYWRGNREQPNPHYQAEQAFENLDLPMKKPDKLGRNTVTGAEIGQYMENEVWFHQDKFYKAYDKSGIAGVQDTTTKQVANKFKLNLDSEDSAKFKDFIAAKVKDSYEWRDKH